MSSAATSLPYSYLVPSGKILLLGCFGGRLVMAMRRKEGLDGAFLALLLGFLGLSFYQGAFAALYGVGDELTRWISSIGDPDGLKQLIAEALKKASETPTGDGSGSRLNLAALAEQVFRTGVWGVASAIAEFFFLLAALFLEVGRTVLWQITLFLFPLACGLIPVVPWAFEGMIQYAIEIVLWGPVLALVEVTTTVVARRYMTQTGSWGLYAVAVELLAVLLILSIPSVTHRLVNGTLHPGGTAESMGLIMMASKAVNKKGVPK